MVSKKSATAPSLASKTLFATVKASHGHGAADTADNFVAGKEYEVLTLYIKTYEDGSTDTVGLLQGEKRLQEVSHDLLEIKRVVDERNLVLGRIAEALEDLASCVGEDDHDHRIFRTQRGCNQ